jgi:alpha-glucosidase (family GH31 glycosyl hydrolase)
VQDHAITTAWQTEAREDEMQRRTFLKKSAIGIGALAGVQSGILKVEAMNGGQQLATPHSSLPGYIENGAQAWGANAVALKTPWNTSPSIDDLLADQVHSVVLDRFYRVGGEDRPATPTQCSISYSPDALFVVFQCSENDMSFPYAHLDTDGWPNADWYSLDGLPSGSQPICPPYPDEVDLLIQPDSNAQSYYQFAVTLQGSKFGCVREVNSTTDVASAAGTSSVRPKKIEDFEAVVLRRLDAWFAVFQIPWKTFGAMPKSYLGLLPMRTRWRDGEFSSPVALDLNESMPVDLLIETHLSDSVQIRSAQSCLCQLPSGILRWQRPPASRYPNVETCRQIWEMELSLTTQTDRDNLAQRLHLTQCWMDLMMQEGFTPLPNAWGILKHDLTLASFRQKVNTALQKNDAETACQLLDTYLHRLDAMSRWWYADGSPGDILNDQWHSVTRAESVEVHGDTLHMRCIAGSQQVDLHLALPTTGGIRIYGADEGYWKPAHLLPLKVSRTTGSYSVDTANGKVVIQQNPFSIAFHSPAGNVVTQIGANSLAFRFDANGTILAIDFRNELDPDEVIYGFGERYDHFNENGKVLTLWGTDNWVGNGLGRANTTYKPLPIFHSSKGYMLFDNSPYRLRADVGKTMPGQYRLTQQGPIFDYYFWLGAPEKALQDYTALTGRPPLPPKWAFQPWMGRGGDAWASGPLQNAVAEEESVAKRFAELDIPHSAIYAEGPSALSPALNQFMTARGIKVLGYFMPAIGISRQEALMPELKPSDLPIVHCGTADQTRALGYIDFTQSNARELCRRALKQALDLGEAGSMVDYGDLVPDDAAFSDGRHGAFMHNFYYYDYQRTISEVFQEKRGSDFVLYARGAAPGTQRWVGQFAGDHPANFNGLKHVVTGALNLCACGYSTWGSDLGGYFGFPQPAVYMRWFQFGCFSPLMRPHGTAPREPWHFGDMAVTNYKFLAWTRENLLNYIYNAASIAHETGIPIMRSMAVAFPGDARVAGIGDQYMFGPHLLVAPVVHEGTFRMVQFPRGTWTSLWDGKTVSGPARLKIEAALDTIPVYLRPGSVMPVELNRELQLGESMTAGRVDALVVTLPDASQTVSLLNREAEAAEVSVQLDVPRIQWTLKGLPEMRYMLVYGRASAVIVKVNGKVVPKLTSTKLGSMFTGWHTDPAGNRLVICLPSQQPHQGELTTEIEVHFGPG